MLPSSHQPVLLQEMITYLAPQADETFIDATFGAGGYSKEILKSNKCKVYGIDQDRDALKFANGLEQQYPNRFLFIKGNFGSLESIAETMGISKVNGIVFDIGVSSMQLDEAARGFSFSKAAPLDMRMDQDSKTTAKEIINYTPENDLANILYEYGGEKKSRRIASAIVKARKIKPIETTIELADIILQAVGKYNDTIHPATRSFQAIRIQVNQEIEHLRDGLKAAAKLIEKNGRILVVTFHSLEDKIVKEYFNSLCGKEANVNRHLPSQLKSHTPDFEFLIKGVIEASPAEIKNNPRARSAKLRGVRRLR
jgi:16S rRNA (cytosine1402-N4)-methyltransferase